MSGRVNGLLWRAMVAYALCAAVAAGQALAQTSARSTSRGVFEHDVVEVKPTGGTITSVEVDNRLGEVRIQGRDSEHVTIAAVKRAHDRETLDRLKVTLITDPNGPVRISTRITAGRRAKPIPNGSVRIDLIIHAPRSAAVNARVWNDKLEVSGMENGAALNAHAGDIAVQNMLGTVVTHSLSGKQNFVDIFGAVDAQAIAGDMDLVIVRGKRLDARVHEGDIKGRQVQVRELSLRTTKGNIRLQGIAVAGGRYRINSYRGNIEVRLGHTVPLSVQARSHSGRVTLPARLRARADDRGALVGSLSAGRPERNTDQPALIELRSRMGNIQFAVIE
ncbi:MAG: DUF4097 domain-containing protein [Proteobacteria bacterium]|nr:DUF4097 domain-containing protein [Pseudomonadota bacterium]